MTSGKEDDDVSVTVTDTDTEVEGIIMTNNNNNNKSDEEAQIIEHAVRSLPSHTAAIDLLSSGVCVRCILRLFGVSGRVYSCSLLSSSYLYSVLEKSYSSHDYSDTWRPSIEAESLYYCSVCLGILQFCHTDGKVKDQVSEFTLSIAEMVKKEGHEIESFCFEISVPPIISANENAIWLCMKNKYRSELWCQEEKLLAEHVSLKDALKMSVTDSLETLLAGKYALGSFHICLTYTQTKASSWLLGCQDRNQDFKRRKTETVDSVQGLECSEDASGEVGSAMDTSLNGLQVSESFNSAPEKVKEPCCLTCHCYRTPIYVGGRYLKYSRNVSQTRWIIDDERMGEASVEEIIGNTIIPICRGDKYKFHAAGREDIDVRMLGSGRPFLVEVQNARHDPSKVEMTDIEEKINNSEVKLVRVKNLKVVGNQGWTLMREGEAEKQKQYAALVWISRSLGDEDLNTLSSLKDMQIVQRTPVRVLHRRSPLDREKIIHWMKVEKIVGSTQYFLLHLCTQAGTYIKEFVHGDLGRTQPSIGSILGCRAEILLLDVTDVKMDCFN